ncbi:xanthine dehydrogenase family protein molybdopterin-binding subunit [Rhizobium sp. CF142]|uniref:xanthine dehydrogenase family protein molybdopterin-binding subunit n=1 Tax=Rhizobium sp. CF142 TaxID=1144314 RepID=UPI0009DB661D|nr:xanthine dehydrogenase family protein molybdopterin-binding subunit [Rhizobium sp. CF142]
MLTAHISDVAHDFPLQLSRRSLLGGTLSALVLGVMLPPGAARAQGAASATNAAPGTRIPAFLEIRQDGTVMLKSPFIEGGQGIFTAMAQIVGEELDVDPARFIVECAPPGPDYRVMNGARVTGGSLSVQTSYPTMRRLGALARQMFLQAAAVRFDVPSGELTTEPGEVLHLSTGRRLAYGDLAVDAARLPIPTDAQLKDPKNFRWIGKPIPRLDVYAKSTGKTVYSIDIKVDGMLLAAVQHAPRLGQEPRSIRNEAQVRAMPGVHSIHILPGAVGVVADRWWRARRAAETLQIEWNEAAPGTAGALPADFSTDAFRAKLAATPGPGINAEKIGDATTILDGAAAVIEATYTAPYLVHGQLEPSSTVARWNEDGTLELWLPNQVPDAFQTAAAKVAGIEPAMVKINSPMLGGFFGRHFLYGPGNPFQHAILMSKAAGQPIKLIWTREDEFLRDAMRPMGVVRFRGCLDAEGLPLAYEAESIGMGSRGHLSGLKPGAFDPTIVEGLTEKAYTIPNKRVAHVVVPHPVSLGHFRSVAHSMTDFFSEGFFDEMADAGRRDPYEWRLELLKGNQRLTTLLTAVGELSGGWRRGPFDAGDGTRRARGIAMASPFGSEVATIAEVSVRDERAVVHDVWVAIDPGSIVNPAIIEAQVNSAVGLGVSTALFEQVVYEDGRPRARNYDGYPILRLADMPRVHVRIIESGAKMGGIGEPGLPGVPAAIANAVSTLTGARIRSLPLSNHKLRVPGQSEQTSLR